MFLRPDRDDARIVGFYVGKVIFLIGLAMLAPAAVALALGEWNSLTALLIGSGLAITTGRLTEMRLVTRRALDWSHGSVTAALSWLVGSMFGAVPLYLSGHMGSFLDAMFEALSGLTTSGLSVLQDLDHLSYSMSLWRHLTHFLGGQGIVLAVITLFAGAVGQVGVLYYGEARDERIMPNVVRTARFIWQVSLGYMVVGLIALTIALSFAGIEGMRILYHAFNIFVAAFDTGGFSTHSTSIGYYHSFLVESVIMVLMVAGAMSFGIHFRLWHGRPRELFQNIETRSIGITLTLLAGFTMLGLGRAGTFTDVGPLFRKGFFTVVSAHTGTGFGVNAPHLFVTDWGLLAPAAIVGAMALGGMASSTAGGIKAIRIGVTAKGLLKDLRRALLPENALVVETFHSGRRRILRDEEVRSAVTILLLYLLTYVAGGIIGLLYGYEFTESMFESTSATANVGLSVGLTAPDLPIPLKITYLTQMWIGRLEFMSAFALLAVFVASFRGRG